MLVIWTAIKLFAVKNWVQIAKWAGITVAVLFVWYKVDAGYDNYKATIEAEKVEMAQMAVDKLAVEIERDRAMQAVSDMIQQRDMLVRLVEETLVEQDKVRKEYEDQLAVFEGHDLEKIAQSKHEVWVGKLATTASTEVLKELENALNY